MASSEAQRKALALLPKPMGVVSIFCSSLIVFSVLRDAKKRARIYHRLLLGISLLDICNSFWFLVSTWPIQRESGAMYAIGNDATCVTQGFFIQAGIATSFYSVSLATYYLLVLRFGWSESKVRRLEPFMHAIPFVWGLGTATIAIPLKLYNNANLWCWIAPYPAGCTGDDCIRGVNADYYRWAFFYGPLWVNIIIVTAAMILVFVHVRGVSHKAGQEGHKITEAFLEDHEGDVDKTKQERNTDKMRRDIFLQCLLYSASFYLNWVWLTVSEIIIHGRCCLLFAKFPFFSAI